MPYVLNATQLPVPATEEEARDWRNGATTNTLIAFYSFDPSVFLSCRFCTERGKFELYLSSTESARLFDAAETAKQYFEQILALGLFCHRRGLPWDI